jgi:hypothetical protein
MCGVTHVSDAGQPHRITEHGDRNAEGEFVVPKDSDLVWYTSEDILQKGELKAHWTYINVSSTSHTSTISWQNDMEVQPPRTAVASFIPRL